ncbi:hypothetical protein LCGC14_0043210 [marine sediment metagenome]|uniref:Uncharacterized protein n=2 Tax=root TaxID=1 RepID=A0A7V1BHV3_9RHOB|nr:hypothetical protein [Sulfitobacter litoralis]HDZ53379.1 hypothetical protein [Sulfitobacter litoralis]
MSDTLMLEATGLDPERLVGLLGLCENQRITGVRQVGNALHLVYDGDMSKGKPITFHPSLMVDTIMEWLGRSKSTNGVYAAPDFGPEPDIDGHCKKGWRIKSGRLMEPIEIHPTWMMFGK